MFRFFTCRKEERHAPEGGQEDRHTPEGGQEDRHACRKTQKQLSSGKKDGPKAAKVEDDDVATESSMFVADKNCSDYPSVALSKEAECDPKKELLAQDCNDNDKEAIHGSKKELLAQDCNDVFVNVIKAQRGGRKHKYKGATLGCATVEAEESLAHHIFDTVTRRWQQKPAQSKPFVKVKVKVDLDACKTTFRGRFSPGLVTRTTTAEDKGLSDTGASVCLAGTRLMKALGLRVQDLARSDMKLHGADNTGIRLLGAVPVIIIDKKSGRLTRQLLYVCNKAASLLLSLEACVDLGMVSPSFPNISVQTESKEIFALSPSSGEKKSRNDPSSGEKKSGKDPNCPCECPVREVAPDPPTELPMEATPENVDKLEQWICDHYASSAFCCCECQPLPSMHGPPIKIHLQEGAVPVASHSPIPIPLHWHKEVKKGLDRDEAIGVIERVPSNTPTTWLSKMVCVPKKDGTPRRTVNFVPLNKFSSRQTHHTMSPFHQASMIPANTYKTVCDAWNGYHSCLLEEGSRNLTSFITPFGRYRYRTLPQGFLGAGDAYTERYDRIIAGVEDKTKIVDDTCLWKNSIAEAFFHTCKYLTLCSRNGIVFNRKKFVFGRETVEFAGFEITSNEVKPSSKIINNIQDFAVPKTISDIRGWFGLINQVAPFYANRRVMEPFRELLKPPTQGKKIYWDENLTRLFQESKEVIINAIKDGIKCFKMGEWTCLMPDFSKTGLGFLLTQKKCSCSEINPYCCPGGWQVVLAGSRFTKDAETRYAPVEGEALAVAWALQSTRHYTLGNPKLLVATDHKPLVKILGDRKLEDIDNPRLVKIKEKTLSWNFKMLHVPGRIHVGPDALSRKEVTSVMVAMLGEKKSFLYSKTEEDFEDDFEDDMEATIEAQVAAVTPAPLTWQQIRDEVSKDKVMSMLCDQIVDGFPDEKKLLRLELREFHHHRGQLTQVDGVPLFKNRVVVPVALRPAALEALHSAHQGVHGMTLRAQNCVWWPGITASIKEMRSKCKSCNENAPSQPGAPPEPLQSPDYPFQKVASDYFQAGGHTYLVVVDRFSGWPVVKHCGGSTGNSRQLLNQLREYFATFGIPEELATDGGLTYTSAETQKFLSDYGVRHRLSSVAYAQSNKRAELGVKSMKRLLRENTDGSGGLDNEKFARALMTYRNTPDRDTMLSPAQVVFGRQLRDFLPAPQLRYAAHPRWTLLREDREKALARRSVADMEKLDQHCRVLPRLAVGDLVLVQNQIGNYPSKWDITGVVVEYKGHDQYVVKIDGSGRLTNRNRRFLRRLEPWATPRRTRTNVQPSSQGEKKSFLHPAATPGLTPSSDAHSQVPQEPSPDVLRESTPDVLQESTPDVPPVPPSDLPSEPPPASTSDPATPEATEERSERPKRKTKAPDRLNIQTHKTQSYDPVKEAVLSTVPCTIGKSITSGSGTCRGRRRSLI